MSALAAALGDYLALRRSLGYKLERAGVVLADFVAHLDQAGAQHVSVELAIDWAMRTSNPDSCWRAQRLGMVRGFARYLHALNPVHQIPPTGLLHRGGRPEPFLFTDVDIEALMTAAASMRSPLRALTMQTLIGLLAVSGLRVGEVIRVDRDDIDVDRGLIVVRNTKVGRSRHVPLLASTIERCGPTCTDATSCGRARRRRRCSSRRPERVCVRATCALRSPSSSPWSASRPARAGTDRASARCATASRCRPCSTGTSPRSASGHDYRCCPPSSAMSAPRPRIGICLRPRCCWPPPPAASTASGRCHHDDPGTDA